MPESFAASEDLGFVALSLPTGGSIWLAAASIYAIETHPSESFSLVKTVGESIGVVETPEAIFRAIEAGQRNSAQREQSREVQKFVDFVRENSIQVEIVSDDPVLLVESDERAKLLQEVGYPVGREGFPGAPAREKNEVDFSRLSDESLEKLMRARGISDRAIDAVLESRREDRLREFAEPELGEDLSDAMERLRRRDREESDRG